MTENFMAALASGLVLALLLALVALAISGKSVIVAIGGVPAAPEGTPEQFQISPPEQDISYPAVFAECQAGTYVGGVIFEPAARGGEVMGVLCRPFGWTGRAATGDQP